MKKLAVLIVFILIPLNVWAADSFNVIYHEKFLANGDTVFVTDHLNKSLLLSLTAFPNAPLAVLMARKVERTKVTGSVNMFSFGHGCWQGNDSECDTFRINDPGYLDAIYTEGTNKGISEFTYTFYNCDNMQDSLQVWAVFNGWTDVGEYPVENEFTISPNPASDYLTISTYQEIDTIEIYSTIGLKVGVHCNEPLQNRRIDVSGLPPGVYFVTFNDETGIFIKY